jgi:4-hydroxybenzoate polyprenyltransferase
MKLFLSYLRLVRPINLIIIAFTLYMVRFYFIVPALNFFSFPLQLKETVFALFALSFVLIAAGGYIINDYYDVEIDKVNNPGRVIIGNTISARAAFTNYMALSVCGLITGAWSCFKAGTPVLELLFVFYVIGLWFYSFKLKSTFFWGNLLIAIFLGLVPFASAYIELQADSSNPESPDMIISSLQSGACGIALFAFLATLLREIVKDMEDIEGDRTTGANTMAIAWGINKTKISAQFLILFIMASLGLIQYYAWTSGWHPTAYYILIAIQIPFIIIIWLLQKANEPRQFHWVSIGLKIVMVTGICYLFVFSYQCFAMLQFVKKLEHLL